MRGMRFVVGLCAVAALALGAAPAHATAPPAVSEDAKRHFQAGVAFLQDPDGEKVEEAYREFRTAFDMSGSPKILGNIGLCAMKLERDGEAIDAYFRYLREVSDIDADERAQIVRDLQTLTVGLSRLSITVDKPGASIVDMRTPVRGERVTNVYGPVNGKIEIGVRPGRHVVSARLQGYEEAKWELDAYAGGRDAHAFALHEPTPPAPVIVADSRTVAPWVVMGTGGAMLIAGSITGIVALGKTSDIATQCPNDVCKSTYDLTGNRASAKTFVRITDVLLIGGGVVTAAGLGWLVFFNGSGDREPKRGGLRPPVASCSADGCTASWGTVF